MSHVYGFCVYVVIFTVMQDWLRNLKLSIVDETDSNVRQFLTSETFWNHVGSCKRFAVVERQKNCNDAGTGKNLGCSYLPRNLMLSALFCMENGKKAIFYFDRKPGKKFQLIYNQKLKKNTQII